MIRGSNSVLVCVFFLIAVLFITVTATAIVACDGSSFKICVLLVEKRLCDYIIPLVLVLDGLYDALSADNLLLS